MKIVLDVSVIIKWFVTEEESEEEYLEQARQLFDLVRSSQLQMIQPLHWQAEVIAVLTRVMPNKVSDLIPLLGILESKRADSPTIYQRAAELSMSYHHHLFDTLYHAVALEYQLVLVTDGRKYFKKASAMGSICLLKDITILQLPEKQTEVS